MIPTPGERPLRILVVDDCPDTASSLSLLFQLWGHQVVALQDGEEALKVVADQPPDVLLVDLLMPQLSGWELTRRLREEEHRGQTGRVFVIAMSGYRTSESERLSRSVGCDLYLTKPIDLEQLRLLLFTLCQKEMHTNGS